MPLRDFDPSPSSSSWLLVMGLVLVAVPLLDAGLAVASAHWRARGRRGAPCSARGRRPQAVEALLRLATAWAIVVPLSVPALELLERIMGPVGYDPWSPIPWMAWSIVMAALACVWPLGERSLPGDELAHPRRKASARAGFLRPPPRRW